MNVDWVVRRIADDGFVSAHWAVDVRDSFERARARMRDGSPDLYMVHGSAKAGGVR